MKKLHLFGIRHHGPGCARSLRAALEELHPDLILVEGVPEENEILHYARMPEMVPPVAVLLYPPDEPQRASISPYALFSPEWEAIDYSNCNNIPLQFIDLPFSHYIALEREKEKRNAHKEEAEDNSETTPETDFNKDLNDSGNSLNNGDRSDLLDVNDDDNNELQKGTNQKQSEEFTSIDLTTQIMRDPIGIISKMAGYKTSDEWWERTVEQANDDEGLFAGILDLMTTLRYRVFQDLRKLNNFLGQAEEEVTDYCNTDKNEQKENDGDTSGKKNRFADNEALREAFMRRYIRDALKKKYERIAIVCGCWHTPVLDLETDNKERLEMIPSVKEDNALLEKLPKAKVVATWAPWSYSHFTYRSGYMSGVESPGWYDHLWRMAKQGESSLNTVISWISKAATFMRREKLDISSAAVIEAVRLAIALSGLRGRSTPGLNEISESIQSVICHGDDAPLRLIRRDLEVGYEIGSVPARAPTVPLMQDIESEIKRLRIKKTEEVVDVDLDLRKETDRNKSRLFHRLGILNILWAIPIDADSFRSKGTFHEKWTLQWKVDFVIQIIMSNTLGCTLVLACCAEVERRLKDESLSLPEIAALLEAILPAELPDEALNNVFIHLQNEAAVAADIVTLMQTLPALARIVRYGDVRGTDGNRIEPVYNALFQRVVAGLVAACTMLDNDAAEERSEDLAAVTESLDLIESDDRKEQWWEVLDAMRQNENINGLLAGYCCRLLYDRGKMTEEELRVHLGLVISPAREPELVAGWVQGFLKGSGQVLLLFDPIWNVLNDWLCSLEEETFHGLLPLLRRAFAKFSSPELRQMGTKVKKMLLQKVSEHFSNQHVENAESEITSAPSYDETRANELQSVLTFLLSDNQNAPSP